MDYIFFNTQETTMRAKRNLLQHRNPDIMQHNNQCAKDSMNGTGTLELARYTFRFKELQMDASKNLRGEGAQNSEK